MARDAHATGTPISITRPLLPPVADLIPYLQDIIRGGWVTNNGKHLQSFEKTLSRYLHADHLAVVTSGTAALDLALRSLEIKGEVITTGFTFAATYQVLFHTPGITPVFADIDDDYMLDPDFVREQITHRTQAIVAVHPYGYPCRVKELEQIARQHGLYLVFDAAPSFGVSLDGRSISSFGDLSIYSFHATKVFSTLEGGCVVSQTEERIQTVRLMRNFGLENSETVALTGCNAKMDEVRAAFGLATLRHVRKAIAARRRVVERYLAALNELAAPDIVVRTGLYTDPAIRLNYAYFPILIRPRPNFSRDTLCRALQKVGIEARKYYFPSILDVPLYKGAKGLDRLAKTQEAAHNVLCLPVHHQMSDADSDRVVDALMQHYRETH